MQGHVSSGPPNINGGNVDTKQISVGATVFMPVFETGAYFAVGDGHAAQGRPNPPAERQIGLGSSKAVEQPRVGTAGDGEVCGSAIETDMWVQARISVIKAGEGPTCNTMQYLSPGPAVTEIDGPVFATTGVGTDLYAASQEAVRDGPHLSGLSWPRLSVFSLASMYRLRRW